MSFFTDTGQNQYDDYETGINFKIPRPHYVDQTLDAPLLDIPMLKLGYIMGLVPESIIKDRISKYANFKDEKWFATTLLNCSNFDRTTKIRLFSAKETVKFLKFTRGTTTFHDYEELKFKDSKKIISSAEMALSDWMCTPLKDQAVNIKGQPDVMEQKDILFHDFNQLMDDCELRQLFAWSRLMELILDRRRSKSSNSDFSMVLVEDFNIWVALSGQFFYFRYNYTNEAVIGSYNMFLSWVDIIRVRFNTRLAIYVLKKPKELLGFTSVQYHWQEDCLSTYGEAGYEIAKSTEALWKAWISRITGGSYNKNEDSYDRMIYKIKQKEMNLMTTEQLGQIDTYPFLCDQFTSIAESVKNLESAVELFGLTKSCGHPVINPVVGGRSAREHAQAGDISYEYAKVENWRIFQHLILINFIRKNGRWPPVDFSDKSTKLYDLCKRQVLNIPNNSYPLDNWDSADISKIFDMDYKADYLSMLKDKACAPLQSELRQFYERKNTTGANRRLLHRMLTTSYKAPELLIQEFASDTLSQEEYNILLHPKECEFKLAARMFCLLTFHMRLILSIIQENVKKFVFDLLPYQSMTMDQVQLMKSLLKMTSSTKTTRTLFIEVDLSRWNLCFRHNFMKGFGEIIDRMFGVSNVFGRAHDVFYNSATTVFVRDQKISQFETGDMNDTDICWSHHSGGFEGIDQATWTIATICMIYRSLWNEKCDFILLGQGDNQTLAITPTVDNKESLSDFADRIMGKIEKSCHEVNHVAKPEEFVDSISTLTYSKMFIVDGSIIPMELKFAMKVLPLTATEVPSYGEAIGGIFSAALGSATNASEPLLHWQLAIMMAELTNQRFIQYGGWLGKDGSQIGSTLKNREWLRSMMLLVPSALGGFPVSTPSSFICRHEPDPVTAGIAWLRLLSKHYNPIRRYLSWIQTSEPYHTDIKSLDKLIQDPYCLPFTQPPTQKTYLEKLARKNLDRVTKNEPIKQALRLTTDRNEAQFIDSLSKMRPFHPTLAHDMYKISIYGKTKEISKMFTLTKTFISGVRDGNEPYYNLLTAEIRYVQKIFQRFALSQNSSPSLLPRSKLSCTIADELRQRWNIRGGIVGLSNAHPMDYKVNWDPKITEGVQVYSKMKFCDLPSSRGPNPPYFGSKTMERRVEKTYEVIKSPAVDELRKLVILSTATTYDTNTKKLLDYITTSRTDYPLDQLQLVFPKTIGGVTSHRYEMISTDGMIGPIGNVMMSSWTYYNSDNIKGVSGGKIDYPIAFQQFFSYLYALTRFAHERSVNAQYASILLTNEQLPELIDEMITTNESLTLPKLPKLANNPILHVGELYVSTQNKYRDLKDVVAKNKRSLDSFKHTDEDKRKLLTTLFTYWCVNSKTTRLQLDKTEVHVTEGLTKIDLFTSRCITPDIMYKSSLDAIARLIIFKYMSTVADLEHRYMTAALAEVYAAEVVLSWAKNLTRSLGLRNYLINQGDWEMSVGEDGHKIAVRNLIAKFAARATELVKDQDYVEKLINSPIYFLRSNNRTRIEIYCETASILLWYLYFFTDWSDSSLGKLKIELLNLRTSLREATETSLDPDLLMTNLVKKLLIFCNNSNVYLTTNMEMKFTELINATIIYVDTSESEAIRWFRQFTTVEQKYDRMYEIQTVKRIKFPSHVGNVFMAGSLFRVEWKQGPPRDLLPVQVPDDHLRLRIHHTGLRVIGKYSSAANLWYGAMRNYMNETNILVVGTGAGGIQALCSYLGLNSIGLDLRSTIPTDRLGDFSYKPPEIELIDNAELSPLCHTTDGDFFNAKTLSTAIELHEVRNIIIDIEKGKHRFGYEVIDQLINAGYIGKISVKFFLTEEEMEWMFCCLKLFSPTPVYVHAPWGISKYYTNPIIYTMSMPANPMYPEEVMFNWHIREIIPPEFPPDDIKTTTLDLLSLVSKGTLIVPKDTIRDTVKESEKLCNSLIKRTRRKVSKVLMNKTLASYYVLVTLDKIIETSKDYDESINLLLKLLDIQTKDRAISLEGRMYYLGYSDYWIRQQYLKIAPRLLQNHYGTGMITKKPI